MGTNLLTGHTDKHWKAVRKGVAPAFSAQHMRYTLTWPLALLLAVWASYHLFAVNSAVLCVFSPE